MSGTARSTVLVVQEDDHVRSLISAALSGPNYEVLHARGGVEGMAAMLRYDGEIALAVLEIKMPTISGLDLANQLAVDRPSTEVLYISDLPNSIAVQSIKVSKPDAVLLSPFTADDIQQRVRDLIDSSPQPPSTEAGG